MLERAIRAISADCTSPSARAGITSERAVFTSPSSSGEYPATGNQPSQTPKTSTNRSPSKKFGIEMPTSASAMNA